MKPASPVPFLALAIALASACRVAPAAPVPTPPGPAPVADARLVTLRNGMQLLLAPDAAATAVDVAVWYRAGTAREGAGLQGISRLFERLMFAGSEHFAPQEHSRLIQATGGQAGAYTTADLACTYQTVPPGSLELALQLEADRIASLRLSPEALGDAVRAVREEARRQSESQPWGSALQAFYGLAWEGHPYRNLAIGPDDDLARITLADCQGYDAASLAPNEALVTVTGRFDPDEALQAAKRWLEPLKRRRGAPAGPGPTQSVGAPRTHAERGYPGTPGVQAQKATRRAWERLDVPVDLLVVGWKVPGHAAPETPALSVLARILAAGPASRLQRALLADSAGCLLVQSVLDARREGGLLYVMAAMKPDADSARVERALLEQMERLAREPVSDEELERGRRQEEVGTLLAWQTARGCAEALGSAQIVDGDWRAAARRFERLQQLTAPELQRAAAGVLVPSGCSMLWVSSTRPDVPIPTGGGGGRPRPGQPSSQGGR